MTGCFEGRERGELLCIALQCCHLIDVAIAASRARRSSWWDETCRLEVDTYAKHHVVAEFLGDIEGKEYAVKVQGLPPNEAIELLHRLARMALWRSDKGPVPPPRGLANLLESRKGDE